MEASSSSKVTVEYHDPSGVFPLISRDLASRLPLRNLNWQSHARPLRQIKHLHVEFVASQETQAALKPRQNGHRPTDSIDILKSGFEPPKPAVKQPRHQVPGLKTTPYLKIYVLRCDDKDWYKQEERNRLKSWVSQVKSEDGKELHDASDWLILHVVIPDTIAASEPRWRESSRDPDELKERSKGKKTVLDRLRADFSNDKGQDHIAQIRLSKSQIAVDLLPVPALAKTVEETADEREKSWADLMTKIRLAILSSFDARVRQYEDDIAEQEARRSLPGWNFCTFFIHKEGLAKALESVGLVEDTLALYDELTLDLETVLADIASGAASQTATTFPVTGTDVAARIAAEDSSRPSRLFDKDYRQEIVRSAISIFDFSCYLYERQMSLLLRLAGRTAVIASGTKEGGDDLVMLAEVCWRGLSFLHNAARALKRDVVESPSEDAHGLVHAWTFYAADFILAQTRSSHLNLTDDGIKSPSKQLNGTPQSPRRGFEFSMGAEAYPQRKSSLPFKKPPTTETRSITTTSSLGKTSEDGFFSPPSSSGGDGSKLSEIPGLAELAAYRAELVKHKRKSIDALAMTNGWRAGWSSLASSPITTGSPVKKAFGRALNSILEDKMQYESLFETLTDTAARHYLLATHQKSSENLMGDLAILKYSQDDYASAATYFEHVLPTLEADGWQTLRLKAQALYVKSLIELQRRHDAVNASLQLLARRVQHSDRLQDPLVLETADFRNISSVAEQLAEPFIADAGEYLTEITLPNRIDHFNDRDGFKYHFSFNNLVPDLELDNIELILQHVDTPSNVLKLNTAHATKLQLGYVDVSLTSNVTTTGVYRIEEINFKSGKLVLRYNPRPKPVTNGLVLGTDAEQREEFLGPQTFLIIYPAAQALDVRLDMSKTTTVAKVRHLVVDIHSGWNDIESVEVRLKPGTAGLRLHIDDCTVSSISLRKEHYETGLISLGGLSQASSASVRIRYSLEQSIGTINVHAEVRYKTPNGSFVFVRDVQLSTILPLDVEVKDIFRLESILSTFTVRTTDQRPVVVNQVSLQDSPKYSATAPPVSMVPTIILGHQPLECTYKVQRNNAPAGTTAAKGADLELSVDCVPVVELIKHSIEQAFQQELAKSEFASVQRLLSHLMSLRCTNALTTDDMEVAVLSHETKVPSFADLDWYEVIDTLPKTTQRPISDWLMKWHIEHQKVSLLVATDTLSKRITIAVDVPTTEYAFLSALNAADDESLLRQGAATKMRLRIDHTRRWHVGRNEDPTKSSERSEFTYEVLVDQNVWLLSGSRKMHFDASKAEGKVERDVILVPLKSGIWTIPTVVIRPGVEGSKDPSSISFEASCVTAEQVVYVLGSERTSRLVLLDDGVPARTG